MRSTKMNFGIYCFSVPSSVTKNYWSKHSNWYHWCESINGKNIQIKIYSRHWRVLTLFGGKWSINRQNENGDTILAILCRLGNYTLIEQLMCLDTINPNLVDNEGNTPLIHAAQVSRFDKSDSKLLLRLETKPVCVSYWPLLQGLILITWTIWDLRP